MHRITLLVTTFAASAALACVGVPICPPIAPGDRLLVPANAPAFVGPNGSGFGGVVVLTRTSSDGGVATLELLGDGLGWFNLYAPGPLARGDLFTLATDAGNCGPTTAAVSVVDAAPFPGGLGTVSLGDPSGFLRPEGISEYCGPEREVPAVGRAVSVSFPGEVIPWLSVMRVRVKGTDADFGHLARSVIPGRPTLIGRLTTYCGVSRGVKQQPLVVELEIAGRAELLTAESVVELDCGLAPPTPAAGCVSVPGPALLLLVLAWWRVRARAAAGARPAAA